MTREQAIEMREVFNAFCDGKKIQFRGLETLNQWFDAPIPLFSEHVEWRVKPEPEAVICPIAEAVAIQVKERAKKGLEKYGVNAARTDLTIRQWLQHLQEELLDAAVYVERLKGDE